MPDNDEKDNAYPPEYAHVGKMVREAQERIREIDQQIKNVPKDQGPAPQYNPPGFIRSRQPGSQDEKIAAFEKQKEQVKADTMEKVDKETIKADPKTATLVRDQAREGMYGNPFKGKDAAEMDALRGQSKDLETSQNYADALRQSQNPERTEKDVPEPASSTTNMEEKKPLSMSARFSQSLSYTREVEKNDKAPDKSLEKTPTKDDKDIDKD